MTRQERLAADLRAAATSVEHERWSARREMFADYLLARGWVNVADLPDDVSVATAIATAADHDEGGAVSWYPAADAVLALIRERLTGGAS